MKKNLLDRPLPFHVILFAVFPVLFLYSFNIREMALGEIYFPLAVSVAGAFLLWAVLAIFLRGVRKAGLAATLFVILFFSYGHLYELLASRDLLVVRHSRLIAAVVLGWSYFVYLIRFARWEPRVLTRVLNIASAALVAVNAGNIAIYSFSRRLTAPDLVAGKELFVPEPDAVRDDLPDIYLIVLDEYAHPDTMARYYDHDCAPFIESLEARGFLVARQSRTLTPMTPQALAQVLNMRRLTPGWRWREDQGRFEERECIDFGPTTRPWSEEVFRLIADSAAAAFLTARGYRYVYFGSYVELGRWEDFMRKRADSYYNYYHADSGRRPVSEFQSVLWSSTMLGPAYFHLIGGRFESYYRQGALETLAHLKMMPSEEGPKFVFAHLMLPHSPFVFGPRGEFVGPGDHNNFSDPRFYLGQYIYVSDRIIELVDSLLRDSDPPPIVIIQSDHGLRCHWPGMDIGREEWKKILNAWYLPGPGREELSDAICPVDTFRFVFNHYFGLDYDLLGDD